MEKKIIPQRIVLPIILYFTIVIVLLLIIDVVDGIMFNTLYSYYSLITVAVLYHIFSYLFVKRIIITTDEIKFRYFPNLNRNITVKKELIDFIDVKQAYLFTHIEVKLKSGENIKLATINISKSQIDRVLF